ncbi:hypothetical protein GOP47_0000391 [Adiantum capillus-veneris]|uniref:Uncharacterized protein n=1 Tax=Adiantum capillus-veneris TaxID=13818 RepID=A0A9D4VF25_ADICA|nr:hypothetical protein GOP47_0000391 [Adiantum capillus-veneris]
MLPLLSLKDNKEGGTGLASRYFDHSAKCRAGGPGCQHVQIAGLGMFFGCCAGRCLWCIHSTLNMAFRRLMANNLEGFKSPHLQVSCLINRC